MRWALPVANLLQAAGRSGWLLLVTLVVLTAMQSAWEAIENLSDTQAQQRRTLRLIYESPLRERRGFQLEGALLCMRDPDPLPVFFSPGIRSRFFEPPAASENTSKFIDEFRNRPIAYIVESYRMKQFPTQIRQFWASHYVWYGESLYLAGFRLDGADAPRMIEVIVPGIYRWDIDSTGASPALRIGGKYIEAGETVELARGTYEASVTDGKSRGRLLLADLPPLVRDGEPAFYHRRQIYNWAGITRPKVNVHGTNCSAPLPHVPGLASAGASSARRLTRKFFHPASMAGQSAGVTRVGFLSSPE